MNIENGGTFKSDDVICMSSPRVLPINDSMTLPSTVSLVQVLGCCRDSSDLISAAVDCDAIAG